MANIILSDIEIDMPGNWKDQGMITFTLPSTDKNVRPNIILTKERLVQPVELAVYFERIKKSIQARGVKSFELIDEFEFEVNGVRAMQMVCRWDLSSMKAMAKPGQNLEHIKPGQMVQQIQTSLIKNDLAVNFTASFPDEQFELYARPFEKFVASLVFK